jgi:hypothetical protein
MVDFVGFIDEHRFDDRWLSHLLNRDSIGSRAVVDMLRADSSGESATGEIFAFRVPNCSRPRASAT